MLLAGAAVVVLVNTWLDFEVFTTQHVVPCGEKLVVTRADSASRRVFELNAEPAALEYARLVGVPLEALDFVVDPLWRLAPGSFVPRLTTAGFSRSRSPALRTRRPPLPSFAEPALPLLELLPQLRQLLAQRRVFFLQLCNPLLLRCHLIACAPDYARWKALSALPANNGPTRWDAAKQIHLT